MSDRRHASRAKTRRDFLQLTFLPVAGMAASPAKAALPRLPFELKPAGLLGKLARGKGSAPFRNGRWWVAGQTGDGLEYRFAEGSLAAARSLAADFLVDGNHMLVFQLTLREGEKGPAFSLVFTFLNQCQARLRMPMEAVNQNRWRFPREGAWLKPLVAGQRVDLQRVDRLTLKVLRKSEVPARWYMSPLRAVANEIPRLTQPALPKGPLLDEFGQSRIHDWPERSRSRAEVTARLQRQFEAAPSSRWPEGYSRWGGCASLRFEGRGFFRTHYDGRRWWLVDPDGYAFWSAGMDCVRIDTTAAYRGLEQALAWMPPRDGPFRAIYSNGDDERTAINYLAANLIHAFGPEQWRERWAAIALGELRRLGFNTVANWSEWKIAAQAGFPYVRPLNAGFRETPRIYRDLPDVYDPRFEKEAAAAALQLEETKSDPAFIGYFLMNEPTWGFASETPAAGMLFTTENCASRKALRDWLEHKYSGNAGLAAAWQLPATLEEVERGRWNRQLTAAAQKDLADFSAVMVTRFFTVLARACRAVDPKHLNLGVRYHTVPPSWALEGMRTFDVFSMNTYESKVRAQAMAEIAEKLRMPVLIGEWHFGALDAGLPASGIGHVRNQAGRGQAFRVYTEDAAVKACCVGVHYFTLYDQSALGRFDGENYNIGFLDVCNRPYAPLAAAARASHERLYDLALGKAEPYSDAPEYLPKLFV